MAQEREHGLGLQLWAPRELVGLALARRRGRPEVRSDLALTDRVPPAASGRVLMERHVPQPGGLLATPPAGGFLRRTARPRARERVDRRAALARLQVRLARPHGPTASGPSGQVGLPGAAGHTGVRTMARGQTEQA